MDCTKSCLATGERQIVMEMSKAGGGGGGGGVLAYLKQEYELNRCQIKYTTTSIDEEYRLMEKS